ncbi:hypothetical protein [Clostridium hydrogenum]|nr:hypothetical protein [Clostridium hydrogenum]
MKNLFKRIKITNIKKSARRRNASLASRKHGIYKFTIFMYIK